MNLWHLKKALEASGYSVPKFVGTFEEAMREMTAPTYNHTRGDSPATPCPECSEAQRRLRLGVDEMRKETGSVIDGGWEPGRADRRTDRRAFLEHVTLLDHGYVKLVDTWGRVDLDGEPGDEAIVAAARMSTQKGFEGWGPIDDGPCADCNGRGSVMKMLEFGVFELERDGEPAETKCAACKGSGKKTKAGDEKLLGYLWRNKHATPFEMAGATFEVQAPIFVFREWHRHRIPFGYNEMSARYAPLPDVNYMPVVERLMLGGGHLTKQAAAVEGAAGLTIDSALEWLVELDDLYKHSERVYQSGLERGVPKELARLAVTVGRYSRMRATGNLRGWLAFLSLRMEKTAQWEIRQYANAAHDILRDAFPRTLALFDEGR